MRDSDIDSRFKLVEGKVDLLLQENQKLMTVIDVLGNWALTNSVYLAKTIGVPEEAKKPEEKKEEAEGLGSFK